MHNSINVLKESRASKRCLWCCHCRKTQNCLAIRLTPFKGSFNYQSLPIKHTRILDNDRMVSRLDLRKLVAIWKWHAIDGIPTTKELYVTACVILIINAYLWWLNLELWFSTFKKKTHLAPWLLFLILRSTIFCSEASSPFSMFLMFHFTLFQTFYSFA